MFSNLFNLKNIGRAFTGGASLIAYKEFIKKASEKSLQKQLDEKLAEVELLTKNALQGGEGVLE